MFLISLQWSVPQACKKPEEKFPKTLQGKFCFIKVMNSVWAEVIFLTNWNEKAPH